MKWEDIDTLRLAKILQVQNKFKVKFSFKQFVTWAWTAEFVIFSMWQVNKLA